MAVVVDDKHQADVERDVPTSGRRIRADRASANGVPGRAENAVQAVPVKVAAEGRQEPATAGAAGVYLHIGLPKSGTSYLQQVLWASRENLAGAGVLVPGEARNAQTLAVWDLMGRRPRGTDLPQVPGSWPALVGSIRHWPGSHALISEEFLALATPRQVRRAVRAFNGAPVHVVVTVRDLARVIAATWQQNLQKGRTWSWEDFVTAVRQPDRGRASVGAVFWLRQDIVRVLDAWESEVPRDRIHLVTVPQPGAPKDLLLERFAAATRVDPALLDGNQPGDSNVAVGIAEAEVLRRLNAGLGGRLNERQYRRAVQHGVKPALAAQQSSTRIKLPPEHHGWVSERAKTMVEVLRERGYEVAGDLDDLIPAEASGGTRPDEVEDAALTDASIAALVAVTEQYADYWWQTRRPDRRTAATSSSRLASLARAIGYRTRIRALDMTERNRLVDRAAVTYLRRSRGGS